jgi:hypothetical protein
MDACTRVNETTVARRRDGAAPTTTSSCQTSPVKFAAAPRRVAGADARTTVIAAFLLRPKFPAENRPAAAPAAMTARLALGRLGRSEAELTESG